VGEGIFHAEFEARQRRAAKACARTQLEIQKRTTFDV